MSNNIGCVYISDQTIFIYVSISILERNKKKIQIFFKSKIPNILKNPKWATAFFSMLTIGIRHFLSGVDFLFLKYWPQSKISWVLNVRTFVNTKYQKRFHLQHLQFKLDNHHVLSRLTFTQSLGSARRGRFEGVSTKPRSTFFSKPRNSICINKQSRGEKNTKIRRLLHGRLGESNFCDWFFCRSIYRVST